VTICFAWPSALIPVWIRDHTRCWIMLEDLFRWRLSLDITVTILLLSVMILHLSRC